MLLLSEAVAVVLKLPVVSLLLTVVPLVSELLAQVTVLLLVVVPVVLLVSVLLLVAELLTSDAVLVSELVVAVMLGSVTLLVSDEVPEVLVTEVCVPVVDLLLVTVADVVVKVLVLLLVSELLASIAVVIVAVTTCISGAETASEPTSSARPWDAKTVLRLASKLEGSAEKANVMLYS
jgi:hypothetical protein